MRPLSRKGAGKKTEPQIGDHYNVRDWGYEGTRTKQATDRIQLWVLDPGVTSELVS